MPNKIRFALQLLKFYGGAIVVLSLLVIALFSGIILRIGVSASDTTLIFLILGLVGFSLGLLHFFVARAISNRKPYGQIIGKILAIFVMVGNFPIGTVIGILVWISLSDKETDSWFD